MATGHLESHLTTASGGRDYPFLLIVIRCLPGQRRRAPRGSPFYRFYRYMAPSTLSGAVTTIACVAPLGLFVYYRLRSAQERITALTSDVQHKQLLLDAARSEIAELGDTKDKVERLKVQNNDRSVMPKWPRWRFVYVAGLHRHPPFHPSTSFLLLFPPCCRPPIVTLPNS